MRRLGSFYSTLESKFKTSFQALQSFGSAHRDIRRTSAAVVVQGGEFITAGRCFPCNDLLWIGPGNECVAREPINFAHIGICFGAQRDRAGRWQQDVVSLRRRNNLWRVSSARDHFGGRSGQKGRWQSSRYSGPAENRQQLCRPEFVNFTPELAGSVISWHAQPARSIDEHFLMHIAEFDWRNSGNEPTLNLLFAVRFGQITRNGAEGDAFQVCTRRREMRLVRLGPACP